MRILLGLLCACGVFASSQVAAQAMGVYPIPKAQPPPGLLQIAIRVEYRMNVLAQRYSLSWTKAPSVQLGFPSATNTFLDICRPAVYTSDPPTIWFNPLPYVPESQLDPNMRKALAIMRMHDVGLDRIIDHELTHHYFDSEHYRLTGKYRPTFDGPDSLAQRLGYTFLYEGLANAVERREPPEATPDSYWSNTVRLPHYITVGSMEWEDLVYDSGYRFVGPLVHQYSVSALVEYMIKHPLTITTTDVRTSLTTWRTHAEKTLSTVD